MAASNQWAVKFHKEYANGESRSTVGRPRTALGAMLEKMFSLNCPGWSRTIVNFNDEMRAWGRHDWVESPTEADLRLATENACNVIPEVPAGGSIQIEVQIEGTPCGGASEIWGTDAK